jgi:SPX domain protein involved in polyphosphate accumulation
LKYILPVSMKLPLRNFIASYLVLDEFAAAAPDFSYPIHSIYMDSPGLQTYFATQNGDKNRFKLRLRYYDDQPGSPVFLEMKRRTDNVIHKKRCSVTAEHLEDALAGDTTFVKAKSIADYTVFCDLMNRMQATPRAHVAYMREAWMSRHDNSVRVTLDSQVRVEPKFDLKPSVNMKSPAYPFGEKMVLPSNAERRTQVLRWCAALWC